MDKINIGIAIEFRQPFAGKRLLDAPEIQLNLICLSPGQAVPDHNANSNVRLLVLNGEATITLGDEQDTVRPMEMVATAYGTPMQIRNESASEAVILVIKAPNPNQLV